ncbi:MAG: haloacid dehalogenase [Erythrobacter sp.]|nr:MAG: haloacid dehalogenase [Erythrobacter sp.]
MRPAAIIFDFDGVIADSEALANQVLAEALTDLGLPTTLEDCYARYLGKRWGEVLALAAAGLGRPLPDDFAAQLEQATLERFRRDLREVPGASAFIRALGALPRAIASSSAMARLHLCLDVLGLGAAFGDAVFSADLVERGKPHPDIFLLAAERLAIAPEACVVIEDSPSGVIAAKAAGMRVIGLYAASHLTAGHAARLGDAGADALAGSWEDIARLLEAPAAA